MIIKVTIFNDPKMLLKRKGLKVNYAFPIHDGVPAHCKVSFHSWAKDTKGQVKAYKNPIDVQARAPIAYFTRAIEQVMPQLVKILANYTDLNVVNNQLVLDKDSLVAGYTYMANLVKETAKNIISAEARDTGDLMSSVSVSEIQIY